MVSFDIFPWSDGKSSKKLGHIDIETIVLLVLNVGNGWEWGLLGLLLMVSQWIIPSFPTFSTSKFVFQPFGY